MPSTASLRTKHCSLSACTLCVRPVWTGVNLQVGHLLKHHRLLCLARPRGGQGAREAPRGRRRAFAGKAAGRLRLRELRAPTLWFPLWS